MKVIGHRLLKPIGGMRPALMGVGAVFVLLLILAPKGVSSGAIGTTERGSSSLADTVEIEVTLNEFSITPSPLRIPAGTPVRLVIRNTGLVDHEFMAGREPADGTYRHDLFEGVSVEISDSDMAMAMEGHAEAEADHEEAEEHEHSEEAEEHAEQAAAHAEQAEAHAAEAEAHSPHGTMVQTKPATTTAMTFTLPTSKRGEWETGCFLPGHFEAGMKGILIVE